MSLALLILDGICGRDYEVLLIDWDEEFWRRYEIQDELEALKREIKVGKDRQLRAKTQSASLTRLNNQFQAMKLNKNISNEKGFGVALS